MCRLPYLSGLVEAQTRKVPEESGKLPRRGRRPPGGGETVWEKRRPRGVVLLKKDRKRETEQERDRLGYTRFQTSSPSLSQNSKEDSESFSQPLPSKISRSISSS